MPRRPAKKVAKPAAKGPSYLDMIVAAVKAQSNAKGVSRRAIKAYIATEYPEVKFLEHFFKKALAKGILEQKIAVHHNHKGSYKIPKKAPVKKKAPAKKNAPAKKKAPAAKKKAPAKKRSRKRKVSAISIPCCVLNKIFLV